MSIDVKVVPQESPLLGRQMFHDSRSFAFPLLTGTIDRSTWRDKAIRLYDPLPNPNQAVGCCTGVAKCNQLNAIGNRVIGRVLDMGDAEALYSWASAHDPWPGQWPPVDTGSSGLASAQAAAEFGIGGEYRWIFGGADEVVQNVIEGRAISVGTWWYWDMFNQDPTGQIHVGGGQAGGHQYIIRGYDVDRDLVLLRCWWGQFRDAWLARSDLDSLLRDGGDAHYQVTT